jgi:hypothetical protein
MTAPRNPGDSPVAGETSLESQVTPVPDEDGPHDVPDEEVIEQTLPTVPVSDLGSRS